MKKSDVDRVMSSLVKKYRGGRFNKAHKWGAEYIQYRIHGWNNNLDYYPGFLSLRILTEQTGGTGMQGKIPRISLEVLSRKFKIPGQALHHRAWGDGRFRSSVGIDYSLTSADSVKYLIEWCLQQFGKKSDESRNLHEQLAIDLLDRIFGEKAEREFTPDWLATSTRGNQRLDGYWEGIGVAVEYHGLQHYEVVPRFHKHGSADLAAQRRRDATKRSACAKAGVTLLEIPYHVNLTSDGLIDFIERNCKKLRKLIR
jgi:hypothetical protein